MAEVRTLTVGAGEDGVRLDRWFRRRWPHLSQGQIAKLARSGQIRVDGARAKPETRLGAGAQVRVPPLPDASRPPSARKMLSDQDKTFARRMVLYEDDEVLALNKPSGLAVQGGTKTSRHVDRLLSVWGEGVERPRLVHRLDRDTSGVLVLGKGPAAAARLAQAFAERRAEKTYWAIVAGRPRPPNGGIDIPLVKSGAGEREQMAPAAADDPRAGHAETDYVTLDHAAERAAWVALRPHTGRTHQLRAHCAAIGTPILGDGKYGGATAHALGAAAAHKLHLHARALEIPHPDGFTLKVTAPLPPHMKRMWEFFGFAGDLRDPFAALDTRA